MQPSFSGLFVTCAYFPEKLKRKETLYYGLHLVNHATLLTKLHYNHPRTENNPTGLQTATQGLKTTHHRTENNHPRTKNNPPQD